MIFSELYSAYYNTVAQIMTEAMDGEMTEAQMRRLAEQHAFSESGMTIVSALKSGKWQLMDENLTPVLHHAPTMPLTLLQKRWLKAILSDPRIQLFGVSCPDLGDVQPLFTAEDYKIYDQYADGDPYADEGYIRSFRLLLEAMKAKRPVEIVMVNRGGKEQAYRFVPKRFEYSLKDDKLRVIAGGGRYRYFNLARILRCRLCEENGLRESEPMKDRPKELTLLIIDERNALERVMLHFAHFEKQAERLGDGKYLLRMKYYESDETEIVIRVLSFGPKVQVIEPQGFVELIKKRLNMQISCEPI